MQPRIIATCCLVGVWAWILAGCQSEAPRNPYPNDPLLIGKKPVEGTPSSSAPPLIARSEPVAPPFPVKAVALNAPLPNARPPVADSRTSRGVVAQPAVARKAPLVAHPAVRIKQPEAEPYAAAVPHPTGSTYGHAQDYSWLQGVLDKHSDGHIDLRYCDPAVEEKRGGKARLEADPRLGQFHDGDIVQVEGELLPLTNQALQPSRDNYWHYRIRTVWLVQPKR